MKIKKMDSYLEWGFNEFNLEISLIDSNQLEIDIDIKNQLHSEVELSNEGLLKNCKNIIERIEVYKEAKFHRLYKSIVFGLEYGYQVFCLENNAKGLNIKVTSTPISVLMGSELLPYITMMKLWDELNFVPLKKIEIRGEHYRTLYLPYEVKTTYVNYKAIKKKEMIEGFEMEEGNIWLSWK